VNWPPADEFQVMLNWFCWRTPIIPFPLKLILNNWLANESSTPAKNGIYATAHIKDGSLAGYWCLTPFI
jgi:hypothetical protein